MYSNNEQLFPFLGQNYLKENFHLANVTYLLASQILTIQSDVYISHLTIRQQELNLPCEQIQLLFQMLFDNFLQLGRSEEHTSELQSRGHLVCRLLLEKKKTLS